MARWLFELIQDGMIVASGDCSSQKVALREAGHYCQVYRQDGECTAIVRKHGDKAGLAARRRLLRAFGQSAPPKTS